MVRSFEGEQIRGMILSEKHGEVCWISAIPLLDSDNKTGAWRVGPPKKSSELLYSYVGAEITGSERLLMSKSLQQILKIG